MSIQVDKTIDSPLGAAGNDVGGRLLSLDVFRGITIAGMILVNSPGNQTAYWPLEHAEWHGCTPTDLIFPFFLLAVGMSLALSFSKRLAAGESSGLLLKKALIRSAIIFGLGLLLNGFPHYDLSTIRILGVLQRIALCYLIASVLYLKTPVATQAAAVSMLLVGYWYALTNVMVPSYGMNDLGIEGNFAAYLDRLVLGVHTYHSGPYDPEGLLSTLPAVATTLMGSLAAVWLMTDRPVERKLNGLFVFGTNCAVLGWLWGRVFPLNKALWTSSYVLWTAGLAFYLFALLYWLIEIKGWRRWSKPFEVFGVNAIAVYVLHILFLKIQNLIKIPRMDGSEGNLRLFISEHLFGWTSLQNASLFYALSYTLLWLVVFWILYRRKIFIKI